MTMNCLNSCHLCKIGWRKHSQNATERSANLGCDDGSTGSGQRHSELFRELQYVHSSGQSTCWMLIISYFLGISQPHSTGSIFCKRANNSYHKTVLQFRNGYYRLIMHPNIIFLYPFIPYKTLSYFLMLVIINCIWTQALKFKLNFRDEASTILPTKFYYDSMICLWYLRICYHSIHVSMDHYVNYNSLW